MDLDIDLGSLLRPTARAAAEAADPAQRVIYPLVPSWHRDASAALAPADSAADVAAQARATAPTPSVPGPAATPPPLRSAEAWVPTQSARLGTWPVPPASNDVPDADARPASHATKPKGSPRATAKAPAAGSAFVALPLDLPLEVPVAAPVSPTALSPAASPIASAPPPEGPAQRRAPVRPVVGAHGQRWLQALSVGLRPTVTARCHPHVIERLAAAWPERQAAADCLDDLLFNRRPGRRGFSLAVLGELCELQRALAERRRR